MFEPGEQVEEAPHADPHAVFVPAPVRHVRQHRHAGRSGQHLARHRLADVPHFEIDDGPEHDARAARQLERRPVDDRRIVGALARDHGIGHGHFLVIYDTREAATEFTGVDTLRILIVGAGIGGLTAALALMRDGHDVEVYEQAPRLAELGAGVQISANGARVLFALGLEDAIRRVWCVPSAKEIRLWNTGETLEAVRSRRRVGRALRRAILHDPPCRSARRADRWRCAP